MLEGKQTSRATETGHHLQQRMENPLAMEVYSWKRLGKSPTDWMIFVCLMTGGHLREFHQVSWALDGGFMG